MYRPLEKLTKYLIDDLNVSLYSGDKSQDIVKLKFSIFLQFRHLINDARSWISRIDDQNS